MDSTIKWVLIVRVFLYRLASAVLMAFPGRQEAAEIFDHSCEILPMLTGLVLGFYFGRVRR